MEHNIKVFGLEMIIVKASIQMKKRTNESIGKESKGNDEKYNLYRCYQVLISTFFFSFFPKLNIILKKNYEFERRIKAGRYKFGLQSSPRYEIDCKFQLQLNESLLHLKWAFLFYFEKI